MHLISSNFKLLHLLVVCFCWCFVCYDLPTFMDQQCPCTNLLLIAYAHVRTESQRHRPYPRKKKSNGSLGTPIVQSSAWKFFLSTLQKTGDSCVHLLLASQKNVSFPECPSTPTSPIVFVAGVDAVQEKLQIFQVSRALRKVDLAVCLVNCAHLHGIT